MKEIKITKEQAAKAPQYVEKWLSRVTRSDWDKAATVKAIHGFYDLIKEDRPKEVILVNGPEEAKALHRERKLSMEGACPAPSNGALWCEWRALYDFIQRECGEDLGLQPLLDLDEAGPFWWWLYKRELAVACAPPTMAFDRGKLDGSEAFRFHNERGPAVAWQDGTKLYFYKGISMEEKQIAERDKTSVDEILAEGNAERRRAMIEMYTAERFLKDAKFEKTHKDKYGTLYKKQVGEDVIAIVQVTNSTPEPDGSFKDYHLFVNPDCRTAKEAVARSFRKEEKEYEPILET